MKTIKKKKQQPLPLLDKFEWICFRVALVQIFIHAPLQIALFFGGIVLINMDIIIVNPLGTVLCAWLLPGMTIATVILSIAAMEKRKKTDSLERMVYNGHQNAKRILNSLWITGFPLFCLHGGIVILFRLICTVIMRLTVDMKWHRGDEPWVPFISEPPSADHGV